MEGFLVEIHLHEHVAGKNFRVVDRFWPFTSSTRCRRDQHLAELRHQAGLSYPVEQRQTSFVLVSEYVCTTYHFIAMGQIRGPSLDNLAAKNAKWRRMSTG